MNRKGAGIVFLGILLLFLIMTSCKGGGDVPIPNPPPTVQKTSGPDGGAVININSAAFEWTGADESDARAIVKYQYRKDGGAWTDMNPLTQTTYTWNDITEGDRTFSVKAFDDEDDQSNPVTWSFTYTIPEFTLTVEASPAVGGDIQIEGQEWKDTDTITVDENTQVDIHAQAAAGYTFEGWYEGGIKVSEDNPYTVTVDENKTVTAQFEETPNPPPTVQKTSGPDGGAVININSAAFEWTGADESDARAIVKYQYRKDGGAWTDMNPLTQTTYTWNDITEGDRTFSVKAFDDEDDQSNPVTWSFTYTIPEFTLTVEASPAVGGDIQIEGQEWKDTDTITVDENTQVDIHAQAAAGYTFEGWYEGGIKVSEDNPYTVTVDNNKTVTAQFEQAGSPDGEWTVTATITIKDPSDEIVYQNNSVGETNVEISDDLESITGVATMVMPTEVSLRSIKALSTFVLNSGVIYLMKEAFPGLNEKNEIFNRNGNTIIANNQQPNMIIEFEIYFNGEDEVTGELTAYLAPEVVLEEEAVITRKRNQEKPQQVIFSVEIPDQMVKYEIECTR